MSGSRIAPRSVKLWDLKPYHFGDTETSSSIYIPFVFTLSAPTTTDKEIDPSSSMKRQRLSKAAHQPLTTPLPVDSSTVVSSLPRLACPFVKEFGSQGVQKQACIGQGFKTTHRVKEHLHRCHEPPIACPRCHLELPQDDELETHLNNEPICDKKPAPSNLRPVLMTRMQMRELGKRRKSNVSEESQWKAIYQILFPDQTVVPSPYVQDNEREYQQHMRTELTVELKKLLVAGVLRNTDFEGVRANLRTLLESAIDSGLVDKAVNRATQSFKRPRSSSDDESQSDEISCPDSVLPKEVPNEDDDENRIGPTTESLSSLQRDAAYNSITSPHLHSASSINLPTLQWNPRLDLNASSSEATKWSFENGDCSRTLETPHQIPGQAVDDWLLLQLEPSSPRPVDSQDYGAVEE
ncbi:hypothetical protein BT63DRAFT_474486 [Microthyrium microscopicum]|uniref:C2H2-type domain-containing protein n=1 Tax=Microthyrium microscopicum TaxID=703497 RepID=A0A6A6UR39_9PEZI|nr:hypothetical protein BT63DRAFT_474486 [Microthyrium microscopicum]